MTPFKTLVTKCLLLGVHVTRGTNGVGLVLHMTEEAGAPTSIQCYIPYKDNEGYGTGVGECLAKLTEALVLHTYIDVQENTDEQPASKGLRILQHDWSDNNVLHVLCTLYGPDWRFLE